MKITGKSKELRSIKLCSKQSLKQIKESPRCITDQYHPSSKRRIGQIQSNVFLVYHFTF